jgi:hypothetical protein
LTGWRVVPQRRALGQQPDDGPGPAKSGSEISPPISIWAADRARVAPRAGRLKTSAAFAVDLR